MTAVIFTGIFLLLAVAAFIAAPRLKVMVDNPAYDRYDRSTTTTTPKQVEAGWPKFVILGVGILMVIISGVILFANSFYTQEVGEAKVIKNFDGVIVREDTTPGADFKAPWQEITDWDILAQQAIYKGPEGKPTSEGEKVRGPQIQFQAKGGVTGDIDVAVRYSIIADKVSEVQNSYTTQENFEQRLIDQDIRSVVRTVPAQYGAIEVREKRGEVEAAIVEGLKERWEKAGVRVDSVALQGIRYSQQTEDGFTRIQQAQSNVATEQANLEAAKVTAQQKVVTATAEAEANRILDSSLTDKIIQQRGIDTLKSLGDKGNIIITDGKTIPMINVPAAK